MLRVPAGLARLALVTILLLWLRRSIDLPINRLETRAATELHMSKTTVLRVLKDFKMYPYMLRLRQEITKEDCAARFAFCEEMLELLEADNSMLNENLFL